MVERLVYTLLPGQAATWASEDPGGWASTDFMFTEAPTAANVRAAILATLNGSPSFTVAGDVRADFKRYGVFAVQGTAVNDGLFTIQSAASLDGDGNTTFDAVTVGGGEIPPQDGGSGGTVSRGKYTASMPLPVGTVVSDIQYFLYGLWAADAAIYCAGDEADPYAFDDQQNMKAAPFDGVYDPAQPHKGWLPSNFTDYERPQFWGYGNADDMLTGHPRTAGVRYATEDTLAIKVYTAIAAPPIEPTGLLIVKVIHFTPVAPIPATFT